MKEALLFQRLAGKKVRCVLCSHRCLIAAGERGLCLVRENSDGTLYTHAYGKSRSHGVDPVERKPLFHFMPGSMTYSVATTGCNFKCWFCQSWQMPQVLTAGGSIWGEELPPEKIVALARKSGCRSIAFTYPEPTICFEYAYDTARLAYQDGRSFILVSNGFITAEALQMMQPYLQAANIDLKSFDDEFYRRVAGGRLQPVLETLKLSRKLGIWLEVTTQIIPTLNDSADTLRRIALFIARELGVSTPWHITRFHPAYDLVHVPETSPEALRKARDIGYQSGLLYVYEDDPAGNSRNTSCANCGTALVLRRSNMPVQNMVTSGRCFNCGAHIQGML